MFVCVCAQIEHDRPEFKGDTMVSFVDGSPMTYYPPEVRSRVRFHGVNEARQGDRGSITFAKKLP